MVFASLLCALCFALAFCLDPALAQRGAARVLALGGRTAWLGAGRVLAAGKDAGDVGQQIVGVGPAGAAVVLEHHQGGSRRQLCNAHPDFAQRQQRDAPLVAPPAIGVAEMMVLRQVRFEGVLVVADDSQQLN
ncbi:hypothetical protein [Nocardia sp. IFM 10818]